MTTSPFIALKLFFLPKLEPKFKKKHKMPFVIQRSPGNHKYYCYLLKRES